MPWVWAAHRQGALGDLQDLFTPEPVKFRAEWDHFLQEDVFCWMMLCDRPVGMVLGRPFVKNTLVLGDFTWFPWASKRNIYESVVNIVNELRKEAPLIFHVNDSAKSLANQVARHGIVRRVGTLHEITDEPLSEFQSKGPKWKA